MGVVRLGDRPVLRFMVEPDDVASALEQLLCDIPADESRGPGHHDGAQVSGPMRRSVWGLCVRQPERVEIPVEVPRDPRPRSGHARKPENAALEPGALNLLPPTQPRRACEQDPRSTNRIN